MKSMMVVRGNLAANPKYFEEHADTETGVMVPAMLSAVVYEPRRIQSGDGWIDDPRGPYKITVQISGRSAGLLQHCDMRQGDPVIAVGFDCDVRAYESRDGHPAARTVLYASYFGYDTILVAAQDQKRHATSAGETHGAS